MKNKATSLKQPATGGGKKTKRNDKTARYLQHKAYRFAFFQIDNAIKNHFFIEAIALEESIISDRLNSMFGKLDLKPNPENELNLAGGCILVKKFISQLPSLQDRLAQNNLDAEQLDLWRESRNQFIHQMVHGGCPVAPGIRPKEYYLRGAQVARTGTKIARVISDWAKKETRRIEATKKGQQQNQDV